MRKIIVLWMVLIIVSLRAFADSKVSFTASAPDVVAVGDQFRLSYTVTTQKVRDFRAPSIKGFDVLMATAEGSFTIPGATITAEGNQMVSNSVYVKVLPADRTNGGASGNSGRQSGSASRASSGTSVSNNDLFITATANKTNLYEQEALF